MELQAAKVIQGDLYQRIATALRSPATLVFIDTSMLFWLYTLGKGARGEFFSWVREDLKERFCIPVWSAHEIQRYIATRQPDLTPLIKHQKAFATTLRELTASLSLFVDDPSEHVRYPDRASYFAELSKATQDLLSLTSGPGLKPDWQKISEEIVPFVNEHLLASNIFPSLATVREQFAARVSGRIPPGFRDEGTKEENKFGDLVIWNEMVRHCEQSETARSVVLLTNDNKDDWVYRPPSVMGPDGQPKSNQQAYETLLTSPLLAHELSTVSSVKEFHLLNATALSVILERYYVRPSPRLFAAVQPLLPDVRPPDEGAGPNRATTTPNIDGDTPASSAEDEGDDILRMAELLSTTAERSLAANTLLERMADANPTVQEAAVGEILSWVKLPEVTDRDLFAIGRHLAAITRTRLQAASNLIRQLADPASLSIRPRRRICAGLFHGLFFDEEGRPRPLDVLLDAENILALTERADLSSPVQLLLENLEPRRDHYLILPSASGPPPTAELTFSVDEKALAGRDQLLQLLKENVEILEHLEAGDGDTLNVRLKADGKGTVGEVLKAVAKRYRVRRAWLSASVLTKSKLAWVSTQGFRNLSADQ